MQLPSRHFSAAIVGSASIFADRAAAWDVSAQTFHFSLAGKTCNGIALNDTVAAFDSVWHFVDEESTAPQDAFECGGKVMQRPPGALYWRIGIIEWARQYVNLTMPVYEADDGSYHGCVERAAYWNGTAIIKCFPELDKSDDLAG